MDVKPLPGLEHLPFAEVWFHEIDDDSFGAASAAARAIGKTGLEVWTTDRTPGVVAFLAARGYGEVRRYVISELDVAAAAPPEAPAYEIVSLAERPDSCPRSTRSPASRTSTSRDARISACRRSRNGGSGASTRIRPTRI